MPKRRPMKALRSLGARMRSRRLHLGRSREIVAQGAEISVTQLVLYKNPAKVTRQASPCTGSLGRSAQPRPRCSARRSTRTPAG